MLVVVVERLERRDNGSTSIAFRVESFVGVVGDSHFDGFEKKFGGLVDSATVGTFFRFISISSRAARLNEKKIEIRDEFFRVFQRTIRVEVPK